MIFCTLSNLCVWRDRREGGTDVIAENTDFLQPMGIDLCATVASDHVAVSINASAQSRCKNSRNYYAEIKRNSAGFLRVFQSHAWELVLIAPPSAKYEWRRWHSAWVSPPATEAMRPRREQTQPYGYQESRHKFCSSFHSHAGLSALTSSSGSTKRVSCGTSLSLKVRCSWGTRKYVPLSS